MHLLPRFFLLCLSVALYAQSPSVFFSSPWGTTFQKKVSGQGDTLSVTAMFSDSLGVYLYDLPAGRIITLSTRGTITDSVSLARIGRGYAGEDFVVRGREVIFLNAVDRRLELFDAVSGSHLRSVSLPADLLADEKSRIRRNVSRIFLDEGRLYVGNSFHVVPVDLGLGKSARAGKPQSAARDERYVLFGSANPVVRKGGRLIDRKGRSWREMPTRYPVWGKPYAWIDEALYSLKFDDRGISIVATPKNGDR